jgi:histidinol-phosphate aminotransferase
VAALASLDADDELLERVRGTIAERDRMATNLRDRLGLSTPPAHANFLWLPAGARAADLTVALERDGLVTRPFPGEGVRITVGEPVHNDLVLDALERHTAELDLAASWLLPLPGGNAAPQEP